MQRLISGRKFSKKDIELVVELTRSFKNLSLNELCLTVCELLTWRSQNGSLKIDSCKKALISFENEGLLSLPKRRRLTKRTESGIVITENSRRKPIINCDLRDLGELKIKIVETEKDKTLWKEFFYRYHYLGVKKPFGPTIRYFIEDSHQRIIACIEFSSSALAVEARDLWIGWTSEERKKNINLIVSNCRFLILPWVKVKNLASKILSISADRIPTDWGIKYGYVPVLLETFVDSTTYFGGCYKAANWRHLGQTKGRGRNDTKRQEKITIKKIFVYPLRKDFREVLIEKTRKKKIAARYQIAPLDRSFYPTVELWESMVGVIRQAISEFDGNWQKRKRIIDTFLVVMLIFRLVLAKSGQSYSATIAELWDEHKKMGLDLPKESPISPSSFCEARLKIDPKIFKKINKIAIEIYNRRSPAQLWMGRNLFAVDGTKLNLPRPLLHEGYELPMPSAHYPQGVVSCLYNLQAKMPVDFLMMNSKDERLAALKHLSYLNSGDAVVYDRGYYSYAMLYFHKTKNIDAIFRMPKNINDVIDNFWSDSKLKDEVVTIELKEASKSQQKEKYPEIKFHSIRMRLIKYRIGEMDYVLGTTIMDPSIPVNHFAEVYHSRWGIEELYKVTKTMLNAEFIRAKSEIGVLQEIYANFTITTLSRIFQNESEEILQKNLQTTTTDGPHIEIKANFSNCLKSVQRQLSGLFSSSQNFLRKSVRSIMNFTSRSYQAARPNRSYERKSVRPVKRHWGTV